MYPANTRHSTAEMCTTLWEIPSLCWCLKEHWQRQNTVCALTNCSSVFERLQDCRTGVLPECVLFLAVTGRYLLHNTRCALHSWFVRYRACSMTISASISLLHGTSSWCWCCIHPSLASLNTFGFEPQSCLPHSISQRYVALNSKLFWQTITPTGFFLRFSGRQYLYVMSDTEYLLCHSYAVHGRRQLVVDYEDYAVSQGWNLNSSTPTFLLTCWKPAGPRSLFPSNLDLECLVNCQKQFSQYWRPPSGQIDLSSAAFPENHSPLFKEH